jgi:hypothetical protein
MDLVSGYKKQLGEIFKKEGIIFAYLFGSLVRGKTGYLSDIDIAVYLREEIYSREYFETKLRILGDLTDLFKQDDIDLVVLNDAPPLVSHTILKEGRLIFCADAKKRIEYEVKATLKYLDWKPYLEKYTQETFA